MDANLCGLAVADGFSFGVTAGKVCTFMDRIVDLIRAKRDGEELTQEDFERLVNGYTRNDRADHCDAELWAAPGHERCPAPARR